MKNFTVVMENVGMAASFLEPNEAKLLFNKIGFELYTDSVAFQNSSFKLLKAGYNTRRISQAKSVIT